MNAYLHPGDKIHIAVGINSTASVADATGQVQNHLKTLEEAYGAVGVSILMITGTPGLLAPVIVAVVREPAGTDDLIPRDTTGTTEPLRQPPDLSWVETGH